MENNNYIAHWGIKGMKWGIRKEDKSNSVRRRSNSDIRESESDEQVTAKERMRYYDQDTKRELARDRYEYKISEKQNERYTNSDNSEAKYKISEMRATKVIAGITAASLAAVAVIKAVGVFKGKNMDGADSDTDTKPKKERIIRKDIFLISGN